MRASEQQLAEAAIEVGLIERPVVDRLATVAKRNRTSLIDLIMHHARFPESALYQALAKQLGLDYIDGGDLIPDPVSARRLPDSLLVRKGVLPLASGDGRRRVAIGDPLDENTLSKVRRLLGHDFEVVVSEPDSIAAVSQQAKAGQQRDAQDSAVDVDATAFLDDLFDYAWLARASDIHLEPHGERGRIRFRIDGRLKDYPTRLNAEALGSVVSRIKILANMDIAEQREPQDGGLVYSMTRVQSREFDVRVATIPTRWGERVTMRILGQDTSGLTLGEIGMEPDTLEEFSAAIKAPHGLILLTGPTGSGKSTTLYGALRQISDPEINIMTVEDPVEFNVADVSQVQVSRKVGFAEALRSFLRHDPDVLMVGEIRDAETADIALKAAMTGHLVFSTLHTNDSPSAVTRLLDIGTERFLLADTLLGVIAQRLLRRICDHCRSFRPVESAEREWLGDDMAQGTDFEVAYGLGCPACLQTGFRGRIGVYESLWVDSRVAEAIHQGGNERAIASQAENYRTLYDDARRKVLAGVIDIRETVSAVGNRKVLS